MLIGKRYLFSIFVIIAVTVFLGIYIDTFDYQFSNNITLIVEVAVGLVIALFIYGVSKKNEIKIKEILERLFHMINTQNEKIKDREKSVNGELFSIFEKIISISTGIDAKNKLFQKLQNQNINTEHQHSTINLCDELSICGKNLDKIISHLDDFYSYKQIGEFKTISFMCQSKAIIEENGNILNLPDCIRIIEMIEPHLKVLDVETNKKLTDIKSETSNDDNYLTASVDRTVYPLDSTIHARANISKVIKDENILFEVFDSNQDLIHSQTLEYDAFEDSKIVEGIYQISFKMIGNKWKINENYTLVVNYGNLSSKDSFVIDRRTPIIQTDKSVYTINDDIIVTVIDPDADKDNQKVEHVGNTKDSWLTLETSFGKIDGYKLKETGTSTGIFQGIVGVLGICKDGTIAKNNFDGKIITEIDGTRDMDGFIGGQPGESIIITYNNKVNTIHDEIYISNFGAAIEFDKESYKQSDEINLTIVAPDFIFDSKSKNEIGDRPECLVTIRTSIDKISQYKLIETGLGSGIFSNKLKLVSHEEKSRQNIEPSFNSIRCKEDDFIDIIFKTFGSYEYFARSLVKPN